MNDQFGLINSHTFPRMCEQPRFILWCVARLLIQQIGMLITYHLMEI